MSNTPIPHSCFINQKWNCDDKPFYNLESNMFVISLAVLEPAHTSWGEAIVEFLKSLWATCWTTSGFSHSVWYLCLGNRQKIVNQCFLFWKVVTILCMCIYILSTVLFTVYMCIYTVYMCICIHGFITIRFLWCAVTRHRIAHIN